MFGFLGSPCASCAPGNTHSTYRSFFCGLSCSLRDDYSPAARFLVNRDSTFLSLLTASIGKSSPVSSMRTCCQPIAVSRPLYVGGLHSRYAAAVTVCGLTAKLEDDCRDESGLRRATAKLLGKAVGPLTDKAVSFLNSVHFPTSAVVDALKGQEEVEAGKADLIEAAEPTARSYGMIFGHAAIISGSPQEESHMNALGRSLGRLIYWKDAYDDRLYDLKRGRFNPLAGRKDEELREHFGPEMEKVASSQSFSGPFLETINEVLSATRTRHRGMLSSEATANSNSSTKDTAKNKRRKKGSCADRCDDLCPCSHGSCGDKMCDCGPGDSGCCDCDCCS